MIARTEAATASAAQELVITRAFDSPRPVVFKAWSGPERLVRWWGPRGFTAPAGAKVEVRAGGAWRVGMRSPAGDLRWLRCVYREVVAPERLAFSWAFEDAAGQPGEQTLVTVSFAEQAGRTRLIVRQALLEEAATPGGPEDGGDAWQARLDRLEDYLNQGEASEERTMPARPGTATVAPSATAPELVVTRVLDAPRSLVFRAWTEPEHLARWWGPKHFTLLSCETDVRPGGTWVRCMRAPDGSRHIKRGVYRELVEPERLVFTYVNEGADGSLGPEMLVTVTFEDHGAGTRLTLRQAGFESVGARDAHEGGWTSCLERFAHYLAKA